LTPYLVNPQGLKLFSAAEMDQTWTKPLYQINVPLGFYWGALSGLNTGLSVWLVTQSALQEAQLKPELHSIFKMFNKYASKIYPSTANAAYTIFHEGLNSQNTTKFPVSIYGATNQISLVILQYVVPLQPEEHEWMMYFLQPKGKFINVISKLGTTMQDGILKKGITNDG
jgi:hypothetical protein